jgi:hypothetical protein
MLIKNKIKEDEPLQHNSTEQEKLNLPLEFPEITNRPVAASFFAFC